MFNVHSLCAEMLMRNSLENVWAEENLSLGYCGSGSGSGLALKVVKL